MDNWNFCIELKKQMKKNEGKKARRQLFYGSLSRGRNESESEIIKLFLKERSVFSLAIGLWHHWGDPGTCWIAEGWFRLCNNTQHTRSTNASTGVKKMLKQLKKIKGDTRRRIVLVESFSHRGSNRRTRIERRG